MICTRIILFGRIPDRFALSTTLNPRPCAFDRCSGVAVTFVLILTGRSFKRPTIRNCASQSSAKRITIRTRIACIVSIAATNPKSANFPLDFFYP